MTHDFLDGLWRDTRSGKVGAQGRAEGVQVDDMAVLICRHDVGLGATATTLADHHWVAVVVTHNFLSRHAGAKEVILLSSCRHCGWEDLVVECGSLKARGENEQFALDATPDSFAAISFSENAWPDLTNRQWSQRVHSQFNQQPHWAGYGNNDTYNVDMHWRHDSAYNKGYNAKRSQTIKGTVTSVNEFTPENGAAKGRQIMLRSEDGIAITALPEEDEDAQTVKEAVEALGRKCLVLKGDLTELSFCDEIIEQTINELGGLDILVSNAAWQNRKEVTDLSEEELDRTLKTNIYAYLRLARSAVPHMPPGSTIIATGSQVGLKGSSRLPDYGASKGAIHSITRSLSKDLLEKGIRVNCVAPGPVWTPLNIADTGMSAEEVAMFGKEKGESEMGRPAQPEELAPSYVFLASNADSSYINGIVLPVMGGTG